MSEKQITLQKQYVDRNKKMMEYGTVMTVFPSFNFYVKGPYDMKAVFENNSVYLGGITVPVSGAERIKGMIQKLPEMEKEAFYNTTAITMDFETEYWFKQQKAGTIARKDAFCSIRDMPTVCKELFTINKSNKKKGWHTQKQEYLQKLKKVFGDKDNKTLVRMTLASMRYASQELLSSIPLPPVPLIVGNDASKSYALQVNEIQNKYRETHDLFKIVYYPLHKQALDEPQVLRDIIRQIYSVQPDIILVGTLDSDQFIFPDGTFNIRKPHFEWLMNELSLYAKSNACLAGWFDKGNFSSSYGLKLVKDSFDFIIVPLKGHYNEGGGGSGGPQYAWTLNEYAYYPWKKYVEEVADHYVNNKTREELEKMTPQQQWKYKRELEIKTRTMQFEHIHVKLEEDGSLDGFEVRLKANRIE